LLTVFIINPKNEFTLDFCGPNPDVKFKKDFYVDSGDGSKIEQIPSLHKFKHIYTVDAVKGRSRFMLTFLGDEYLCSFRNNSYVERIEGDLPWLDVGIWNRGIFNGCTNLKSISSEIFKNNADKTRIDHIFFACNALKSLNKAVFRPFSSVESARYAFGRSGLLYADSYFYNSPKIRTVEGAFSEMNDLEVIDFELFSNLKDLEIADLVFYSDPKLASVGLPFKDNRKLKSIKKGLSKCPKFRMSNEFKNQFSKSCNIEGLVDS